jgi:hypothetical protein
MIIFKHLAIFRHVTISPQENRIELIVIEIEDDFTESSDIK